MELNQKPNKNRARTTQILRGSAPKQYLRPRSSYQSCCTNNQDVYTISQSQSHTNLTQIPFTPLPTSFPQKTPLITRYRDWKNKKKKEE